MQQSMNLYMSKSISLMKAVQYISVLIKPKYLYYSLTIRQLVSFCFFYTPAYIYTVHIHS